MFFSNIRVSGILSRSRRWTSCEVWVPVFHLSVKSWVFLKTEFVSFRGLPSILSPSRNNEALPWGETGCISWPHCPDTGCLSLSLTRGGGGCIWRGRTWWWPGSPVTFPDAPAARVWPEMMWDGISFPLRLEAGSCFSSDPIVQNSLELKSGFAKDLLDSSLWDGLLCMWTKWFLRPPPKYKYRCSHTCI